MRAFRLRVALAAVASRLALAAVASAQSAHTELGPPTGAPTRKPGATVPPKWTPPAPPDGSDQNATGGLAGQQNETAVAVNPLDPLNIVGVSNDYSSGNVLT